MCKYSLPLVQILMLTVSTKFLSFIQFSLLLLVNTSFVSVAHAEKTWQRIDIDKKVSLRGSAISEGVLWVSGSDNVVFVSTDKGKTWVDRSVNVGRKTDFRDITLFNKDTAIVMGAGEASQSVLYKTMDAGRSWQLLYENTDPEGFYDSIAFWDDKKGLLLGDPVDGFYVVKITYDGGQSWRRIAKINLPAILEKEAAFAASGNTLITGEDGQAWLTTGGFSASVYYSDDFGENWRRQTVPLFADTQTAGGYGLALNSERQAFVLGGDYQQRLARYSNIARFDGKEWHVVDSKQRGLRTAMSCVSITCIATGKTSGDISYDNGITWQAFDDKAAMEEDRGFYTLASDKQMFLAAGSNGKVALYHIK